MKIVKGTTGSGDVRKHSMTKLKKINYDCCYCAYYLRQL